MWVQINFLLWQRVQNPGFYQINHKLIFENLKIIPKLKRSDLNFVSSILSFCVLNEDQNFGIILKRLSYLHFFIGKLLNKIQF